MITPRQSSKRFTQRSSALILLAVLILLATACSATRPPTKPTVPEATTVPTITTHSATLPPISPTFSAVTPEPVATTELSQLPTPDPCTGWSCTLSGTVYSGTADSGHELTEATVILNHLSFCSPTSGRYTITTQLDGKFAFPIYLHDTDTFIFRAETAGASPVEQKLSGFDCLYCGCQPLELVLASSSATATQTLPDLTEMTEAWRLLTLQGEHVWPGWGSSRIPLLIRHGEFDLLIGHPAPPAGFNLLLEVTVGGQPVYRYTGHLVPVPAATAWEVGQVWSVAAPTREEFQQAIDAQLGKGAVQLDAVNYIRAIVHEAFHAYAMTAVHGQVPDFGADVDEGEMLQHLSTLPDPDQAYIAEGQALVKALQTTDPVIQRESATEFLKLRQARRAAQDQKIAAYERTTEWVEGLARYSEVDLMQRVGAETDRLSTATIHYPGSADVWQPFLEQLAKPTTSPDGFRGRYYLLGAGQAFLLDRLMPGWKARVLTEKIALEDLLQQAMR